MAEKGLGGLGLFLGWPGLGQETREQLREQALPQDVAARLSNACSAWIDVNPVPGQPASASIYQLDGLVRRAASLQQTADAKGGA